MKFRRKTINIFCAVIIFSIMLGTFFAYADDNFDMDIITDVNEVDDDQAIHEDDDINIEDSDDLQIVDDKPQSVTDYDFGFLFKTEEATDKIKELTALGIMESEEETDIITFRNLCGYISRMAGCFVDTNASKNEAISFCENIGIVKKGEILPTDYISMQQAGKLLLSFMGYDSVATSRGGYPLGYMSVAISSKLFDGVDCTKKTITAEEMARILHNSLSIRLMQSEYLGLGEYVTESDGTILSSKMRLDKIKGILSGVGNVDIGGYSREGYAYINGGKIKCDDKAYENYVGMNVTAYIRTNADGMRELVYAEPWGNNLLQIHSRDYMKGKSNNSEVTYEKNGKVENAKISARARVIYNGRYEKTYTISNMPFDYGEMQLIDNDGDEVYDLLKVWNFEIKKVESVNYTEKQIVLEGGIKIGLADDETVTCIVNRKRADYIELTPGNIVLYATSDNSKNRNILMAKVGYIVEGEVTKKIDNYITINGAEEYYSTVEDIYLGNCYSFYVDVYGNIVYSQLNETDNKYGYIVSMEYKSKITENLKIKMFLPSGCFAIYSVKKNVGYNDIKVSDYELYNLLSSKPQLVMYSLDSRGFVNRINLAKDCTGSADGYNLTDFSMDFSGEDAFYVGPAKSISTYYVGSSATTIMNVPDFWCDDEDEYGLNYSFTTMNQYNVEIYDSNENYVPKILIRKKTARTHGQRGYEMSWEKNSAIVLSVSSKTMDDDGEILCKYDVLSGGEVVGLYAEEDYSVPWTYATELYDNTYINDFGDDRFVLNRDLKVGDIIHYTVENGRIAGLRLLLRADISESSPNKFGYQALYDLSIKKPIHIDSGVWYTKSRPVYVTAAKVKKVSGNRIILDCGNNCLRNIFMTVAKSTLSNAIVLEEKERYELAAPYDLNAGDNILLHMYGSNMSSMVILRK